MPKGAQRLAARLWHRSARCVLLPLCLWLAGAGTVAACDDPNAGKRGQVPGTAVPWRLADGSGTVTVSYGDLTSRYGHAVLGDGQEPTALLANSDLNSPHCGARITLDRPHVFEDTAPRLVDLNGNGLPEIITVRSHEAKGAQIAIYALDPASHQLSLLATTPYIGTRFRWLAPLGASDLDADGAMEIAYVDRPHLAKTLRVWRFGAEGLTEIASFPGVTNHRIGEPDIAGGIRTCAEGPEMIVATADWSALLAVRFGPAGFSARAIGTDTSRAAFARAMACDPQP